VSVSRSRVIDRRVANFDRFATLPVSSSRPWPFLSLNTCFLNEFLFFLRISIVGTEFAYFSVRKIFTKARGKCRVNEELISWHLLSIQMYLR